MRIDTRTAPSAKAVYLFSGILICGCCGNRMTRKTVPYKGQKYFYYFCPTGKKNGCAGSNMIKESELSNCVLINIKAHIDNIVSMKEIIDGINDEHINRALIERHNRQINENERQLERYRNLKAGLYEDMTDGIISKDEHKRYKDRYNEEYSRLELAIEDLKNEIEDLTYNKSERLKWIEHFKQFAGMNEIDRTAIVHLIQSITILNKTTLEIKFNYAEEYTATLEMFRSEKLEERMAV